MAHAARQRIGNRSHQCDATATHTIDGTRAYALLDGIGSSSEVQEWTRATARRLATAAAACGSAETGLRALHAWAAAEEGRSDPWSDLPTACAVVAVHTPRRPLTVAWCGDARAYHLPAGGDTARLLTRDHNMRQVMLDNGYPPARIRPGRRNIVVSYLGHTDGEPLIGNDITEPEGRLLLASDGAYEPLADGCVPLEPLLAAGDPATAARALVTTAIDNAPAKRADNATALVADLT
ncbi:mucin-2 [Streptomyces sp. DSM 42041]|uniref:Mucin-2 n=1 Tax=Streptomyces hazeniae TaxID=3075538 RepID=A0ABU2NJU3_9ACTN|nr:mucin-2 [Streptomyces sp. DSM 42041]MDT0377259.1 mucin-2 [Streptomyces sp. DSM 42041]